MLRNWLASVEHLWHSFCQYSSLNEPALYPQENKSNGPTLRWSMVSVYIFFKLDVLCNLKVTKVSGQKYWKLYLWWATFPLLFKNKYIFTLLWCLQVLFQPPHCSRCNKALPGQHCQRGRNFSKHENLLLWTARGMV